jgi:hypothetical protein
MNVMRVSEREADQQQTIASKVRSISL